MRFRVCRPAAVAADSTRTTVDVRGDSPFPWYPERTGLTSSLRSLFVCILFFFFLIHTITKCTHSGSLCSYSFKANVTFTRFFFYYYITNIIIRLCEYKGTSSSVLCGLCDSFDIIHVCYRH